MTDVRAVTSTELHPAGDGGAGTGWLRTSVVYQVYPRSFADGNGDGVGDLIGLRSRLDHLSWLGVDAVWLSPIFPSPMADNGYDVTDHCGVDPVFGSLDDLTALVDDCHRRNVRVMLDWVPNHTSSQHEWFVESRRSRHDPKRDWYVWRDPAADGGPPNNWRRAWSTKPAWTLDPTTGQYYLHCYLPEQPDLDWHHPDVEAAMHDTLRFWLDHGVDGFRADVVHLIGKDPELADLTGAAAHTPASRVLSGRYGHELLRRIRRLLDDDARRPEMVGEIVLFGPGDVARYYGDDDELHQAFDFRPIKSAWTWQEFSRRLDEHHVEFGADRWPTRVLGNHDNPRQRTRFETANRARAAAVWLLAGRGTPYLYAGEELGLPDADVAHVDTVDPGGRDGCRAPLPWTARPPHGWPTTPWLPFVDDAGDWSVERQRADTDSVLHLYRRLIALRGRSPALAVGGEDRLDLDEPVLGWVRHDGDERVAVAINFSDEPHHVELGGRLAASSRQRSPGRFDGVLAGDEAVVVMVDP